MNIIIIENIDYTLVFKKKTNKPTIAYLHLLSYNRFLDKPNSQILAYYQIIFNLINFFNSN